MCSFIYPNQSHYWVNDETLWSNYRRPYKIRLGVHLWKAAFMVWNGGEWVEEQSGCAEAD